MNLEALDFSSLQPGTVIDTEQLESILQIKRDDRAWQFSLMVLQQEIGKRLAKLGIYHTVAIKKSTIEVLEPLEASQYNQRKFEAARHRLRSW